MGSPDPPWLQLRRCGEAVAGLPRLEQLFLEDVPRLLGDRGSACAFPQDRRLWARGTCTELAAGDACSRLQGSSSLLSLPKPWKAQRPATDVPLIQTLCGPRGEETRRHHGSPEKQDQQDMCPALRRHLLWELAHRAMQTRNGHSLPSASWRARDPGGVRSESEGPRTRSADAPEQERLCVLLRRRGPSHASCTAPFPQAQGTGSRPPVEGNQLFLGPPSSNAHLFQRRPRRHSQKRVRLTVREPSAQPSRHEAAPSIPPPTWPSEGCPLPLLSLLHSAWGWGAQAAAAPSQYFLPRGLV